MEVNRLIASIEEKRILWSFWAVITLRTDSERVVKIEYDLSADDAINLMGASAPKGQLVFYRLTGQIVGYLDVGGEGAVIPVRGTLDGFNDKLMALQADEICSVKYIVDGKPSPLGTLVPQPVSGGAPPLFNTWTNSEAGPVDTATGGAAGVYYWSLPYVVKDSNMNVLFTVLADGVRSFGANERFVLYDNAAELTQIVGGTPVQGVNYSGSAVLSVVKLS